MEIVIFNRAKFKRHILHFYLISFTHQIIRLYTLVELSQFSIYTIIQICRIQNKVKYGLIEKNCLRGKKNFRIHF